jgi:hypothetical protein
MYEDNEYVGSEKLDTNILVNGTKQHDIESWIEEDYEYDHAICINGEHMELHIPIEYCPKCGRKL